MEHSFSFLEFFSIIARRKWYVIFPLITVISLSTVFTLITPKIYISKAVILVDFHGNDPIKGVFDPVRISRFRFKGIISLLSSRAKVEEYIKKIGLEQSVDGPREYESLVTRIKEGIRIFLKPRTNMITIAVREKDPRTAMKIANTITSYFTEKDINYVLGDLNVSGTPVLQELIDYYQQRIDTAQAVLAKFELEHRDIRFKFRKKKFNPLEASQLQLAETDVAIREETEKKRLLEEQLAGNIENLPDFDFVKKEFTPDEKRLNKLSAERESLLEKYTPRHPEIILIDSKIEAIKQKILDYYRKEGTDLYAEEAVNLEQAPLKPQYLKLRKILDETNERILDLQKKKDDLALQIQQLNEHVRLAPGIQQEYAALQRDLNVNKKIHVGLITKAEKSRLAREIDNIQKSNRFTVIRPAQLPTSPFSPKVGRNIIIATVAGMLIGIAFALGIELRDHSLRNLGDAKEFLSIPILSTIPTVSTDEEIIRKRRINMMIAVMGTFYVLFFLMLVAREMILLYAPELLYLQTYKEWFYQLSQLFNS
jgi:polysaccharide chain length determinant protein (PEP-CTERM system associated)